MFSFLLFISKLRFSIPLNNNELARIFPILDDELNLIHQSVTSGFNLSNRNILCRDTTGTGTTTTTNDGSGEMTPISVNSDWEFNTNDATKGSNTTTSFTNDLVSIIKD